MKPKKMVALLESKLTKDQIFELFELIDGEGPAGPFWEELGKAAERARPEEFVVPEEKL